MQSQMYTHLKKKPNTFFLDQSAIGDDSQDENEDEEESSNGDSESDNDEEDDSETESEDGNEGTGKPGER